MFTWFSMFSIIDRVTAPSLYLNGLYSMGSIVDVVQFYVGKRYYINAYKNLKIKEYKYGCFNSFYQCIFIQFIKFNKC